MAYASAYTAAKAAIQTRLQARSGLADVAVGYDKPSDADDVRTRGSNEAIWFGDAEGSFDDVVLCAGNLRFDETLTVTLVIQVLRPTSTGSQQSADARVDEILYEVAAEFSGQNSWDLADLDLDAYDYFQISPRGYRRFPGFLSPEGHADRIELDLLVRSRRSFP